MNKQEQLKSEYSAKMASAGERRDALIRAVNSAYDGEVSALQAEYGFSDGNRSSKPEDIKPPGMSA